MSIELPEVYTLGGDLEGWAVYTVNGGDSQETASVRVPLKTASLRDVLETSRSAVQPAARDVEPQTGISLVMGAAAAAVLIVGAGAFGYTRRRGAHLRANRANP